MKRYSCAVPHTIESSTIPSASRREDGRVSGKANTASAPESSKPAANPIDVKVKSLSARSCSDSIATPGSVSAR